jgi:uncharacterized protein YeaO (DUF488 family)
LTTVQIDGTSLNQDILWSLQRRKKILKEILARESSSEGAIITLLYSSKERQYNNAVALKEYLEEELRR